MAGFDIENMMSEEEAANLFLDSGEQGNQVAAPEENKGGENIEKENNDNENTTEEEVDVDNLFTASPESVGSGKTGKGEDTDKPNGGNTSSNFYSSIANALKAEGIFPDLDDEVISKVQKPEDFRDLIDQQIKAGLDETQKRVNESLNLGIEPNVVKQYESTIAYLDSIDEQALKAETPEGENLRKTLLMNDYVNRGFSKERAVKEVEKSLNNGSDITDAQDALDSIKSFYKSQYEGIIKKEGDAEAAFKKKQQEDAEKLKTSIIDDEKVFGDLVVDKNTRKKIYDNIMKPVYKDPKTGDVYTEIQKYEHNNPNEFLKYVGLCYTLTEGFKNFNGLVEKKVKKGVSQGLRDLESKLNNTSRNSDGNLQFMGFKDDKESSFLKDYTFDV